MPQAVMKHDRALTLEAIRNRFVLRRAMKVTLAILIATTVVFVRHIEMGYFMALATVVIMTTAPGHAFGEGVRVVGAGLFVGLVVGGLALAFPTTKPIFLMASLLFLFLWLAYVPDDHLLGYLIGGVMIALLIFVRMFGTIAHTLETAGTIVVQFLLAWLIMSAVERFVWPRNPVMTFRLTIAALFRHFADLAAQLSSPDREPRASARTLSTSVFRALLQASRFIHSGEAVPSQARITTLCNVLYYRLEYIRSRVREGPGFSIVRIEDPAVLTRLSQALSQLFREASEQFLGASHVKLDTSKVRAALDELDATYGRTKETAPDSGVDSRFPISRSILHLTELIVGHYNDLVSGIKRKAAERTIATERQPSRLRTSEEKLHRGGRIVLIVALLMLLLWGFGLPANTPVAFYAVSIGMAANLGQVRWSGQTGVLGAFLGLVCGALGMFLLSNSPHLLLFYLVYSLLLFVSVYFAIGSERYGFGGVQAALIIPFIFLVYNGPMWTFENSVTRIVALALASVVVFVVMRYVWPLHPVQEFKTSTAKILRSLGSVFPFDLRDESQGSDWRFRARRLQQTVEECHKLARDAACLNGSPDAQVPSLLELLEATHDLYLSLVGFNRFTQVDFSGVFGAGDNRLVERFIPMIEDELETTRTAFLEAAECLDGTRTSLRFGDLKATREELSKKGQRFLEAQEAEGGVRTGDEHRFFVFVNQLLDLTRTFDTVATGINDLRSGASPERNELVPEAASI